MISHIRIKDFAIIDKVELDFHDGLNIITGETGAGKSILIEAVSLALGSRADTAFIRSGKDKAVVQMIADLDGEEYIITRELSANGKNICKINDEIVPLAQLNKLCRRIADVHGQYDHQSLLNPENHIKLIDSYHDKEISAVKDTVSDLYHDYASIRQELDRLLSNQTESERKRDFMKFELSEISKANPIAGEDESLTEKLNLLQNSEKIYQNLSASYDLLYGSSPSSLDSIGKCLQLLHEISGFSGEINSFHQDLSDTYYKLEDFTVEIRRFKESVSFSPEELEETISRLNILDGLKRKYGGSIDAVLDYQQKITDELNQIENVDSIKDKLTRKLSETENKLAKASSKLSDLRKKASDEIEKQINMQLKELNFKDANLTVKFYNEVNQKKYTVMGVDQIEFLISTNKGETPKPLVKIASGGEISRIMLAFKQIIGDFDSIPTMIFDEIDVGISGITASIVGKKLLDISGRHQIICITHLPQIAAFGDYHYKIDKEASESSTRTVVYPLSHNDKVKEIARLLGGINITDTTLKSAEELLALSRNE